MRSWLLILLTLFTTNAIAFEQWEHKRISDLAYYLAMEIHCSGAGRPAVCQSLLRETRAENQKRTTIVRDCDKLVTKQVCDLYENISKEAMAKKPDAQRLQTLNVDLEQLCAAAENYHYCQQRNYFHKHSGWYSQAFFDPVYSGDQLDSHGRYTDEKISYGDVTSCVDYFLTPEKLMAGSETSLFKPMKTFDRYETAPKAAHLFPERRAELDLSVSHRCYEAIWNFEGDRSAHVNHTHFQSELLISQRKMHVLAISLRTMENNLFAALTANAISDHYLQDAMAPGHITSWRSRLTDVAANAFHDKGNRDGINAKLDKVTWAKINTLRVNSQPSTIVSKFIERSDANSNGDIAQHVRAYFLQSGQEHRRDMCGENLCAGLSDGAQLAYIKKIADELEDADTINLRGDDLLWTGKQAPQRLLVLVTQVRSILDVLQSESIGTEDEETTKIRAVDSFKNSNWQWVEVQDDKRPELTLAGISIIKASDLNAQIGAVTYYIPNTPQIHGYQPNDSIYGLSLGFDNMLFGDQHNRSTLSLERLIIGNANEKRDLFNLALIGGLQASHSVISNGAGASLRPALVIPQIETIVSLPLRYIRINNGPGKGWYPTWGIRLEQGFSSFSTFYLQVTRDTAPQKDGTVRKGLSIGAGLGFAAPECRIPFIKSIINCH